MIVTVFVAVRMSGVVSAQEVATEIVLQIAPDTMDVIRIVLCVVVLDQHGRTMNTIVVRLAGFDASCPTEMQCGESGTLDTLELLASSSLRHSIRVEMNQLSQLSLLALSHLPCRKTFHVQRTRLRIVARHDVGERSVGKHRLRSPLLRQHLDERAREIFLCSSVREIVPVTKLGDAPVGSGAVGPETKRLLQLYRAEVAART